MAIRVGESVWSDKMQTRAEAMAADGKNRKQIAAALGVSTVTVQKFIGLAFPKAEPTCSRTLQLPTAAVETIEAFVRRHNGNFNHFVAATVARAAQEITRCEGSRPGYGDRQPEPKSKRGPDFTPHIR